MWVVKICKLCIYAGFNFIDQSEAVCCQRAGVCHLLCSRAVLTCMLLLTLCTWFPTHPPDSVPPLPALALPAVAPAACQVFVFRLLTCARWLLARLPPAACRPLGLPACPPLAVCSISGYWPLPVRLLSGCSAACRCVYLCISIFNFVICSSACTFICPLTISPYVCPWSAYCLLCVSLAQRKWWG
jgi:hypothetical protein